MNIRTDIIDIFKVNGVSFGALGLTQADIIQMNELVQHTGNSILISLAIGYSLMKLIKLAREMYWEKQDRLEK